MNISDYKDSELIAELHERMTAPKPSKLEKLIADYCDYIDMRIDDCCDELEELKDEFKPTFPFGGLTGLGAHHAQQLLVLGSANARAQQRAALASGSCGQIGGLAAMGGLHRGLM